MISYFYSTRVNLRQTANTSGGATVWALTNPSSSTKIVSIEDIILISGFDSTTLLSNTTLRYCLRKFNTATPTGGVTQTPEAMLTTNPTSEVTDIRSLDTGLTVTNVIFGQIFCTIGVPSIQGATSFFQRSLVPIFLSPGEGLAIQLQVNAATGQSLTGEIIWSEK